MQISESWNSFLKYETINLSAKMNRKKSIPSFFILVLCSSHVTLIQKGQLYWRTNHSKVITYKTTQKCTIKTDKESKYFIDVIIETESKRCRNILGSKKEGNRVPSESGVRNSRQITAYTYINRLAFFQRRRYRCVYLLMRVIQIIHHCLYHETKKHIQYKHLSLCSTTRTWTEMNTYFQKPFFVLA